MEEWKSAEGNWESGFGKPLKTHLPKSGLQSNHVKTKSYTNLQPTHHPLIQMRNDQHESPMTTT